MISSTIPIVHKIEIFSKNPAMSKMIPRTITMRAFLFRAGCALSDTSSYCATLAPVHHP